MEEITIWLDRISNYATVKYKYSKDKEVHTLSNGDPGTPEDISLEIRSITLNSLSDIYHIKECYIEADLKEEIETQILEDKEDDE